MGIVIDEKEATRYDCLECGFTEAVTFRSVPDGRPTDVGV